MLADIGVTRADVRDAFSSRFWEDPTDAVAERVGERRCHPAAARRRHAADDRAAAASHPPPAHRPPARQTI